MLLEGSCHCGAVKFRAVSHHPYPFNRCYCSICRKTAGGGGYAINLRADTETLEIEGEEAISTYQALIRPEDGSEPSTSPAKRHFCRHCGSALWLWDPRWPEMVHPFASAIDTPLPAPPETTHLMLDNKAPWVRVQLGSDDKQFGGYPDESIADWHDRLGLGA